MQQLATSTTALTLPLLCLPCQGSQHLRANAAATAVDEHHLPALGAAHIEDVEVGGQRGFHEAARLVVAQALGHMQHAARIHAHLPSASLPLRPSGWLAAPGASC